MITRPPTKERPQELLYIIAPEGVNQEQLYFIKLQDLINAVPGRSFDVRFDFATPYGGNPRCVVERAVNKSIGKTNKAAFFDYDNMPVQFEEAINLAVEKNIEYGYSNYCFDLWLLFHKMDVPPTVSHQSDYAPHVISAFGLPSSADIKCKESVETILEQIDLNSIADAIERAKAYDAARTGPAPHATPVRSITYYDNPDTRVHIVLESIFKKAGIDISAFKTTVSSGDCDEENSVDTDGPTSSETVDSAASEADGSEPV